METSAWNLQPATCNLLRSCTTVLLKGDLLVIKRTRTRPQGRQEVKGGMGKGKGKQDKLWLC